MSIFDMIYRYGAIPSFKPRLPKLRFPHVLYTERDGHLVIMQKSLNVLERITRFVVAVAQRLIGRLWVLDPDFETWWAMSSDVERRRAHVGRHRAEGERWRNRWAEYDTQWWPTLEVSGDAEELVTMPELSFRAWEVVQYLMHASFPPPKEHDPLTDDIEVVVEKMRELIPVG